MESQLITIAFSVVVGLFTYLVRSYFTAIQKDIRLTETRISALEGKIDHMRQEHRDVLIDMVKAKSELDAIWRYVDAPRRKTDARSDD